MNHHSKHRTTDRWGSVWNAISPFFAVFFVLAGSGNGLRADGDLTLHVVDEASGDPTIARMELTRQLPVTTRRTARPKSVSARPRRAVSSGPGFVIDESAQMSLEDGAYQFKVTRGPESRVLRGNFLVERNSADEHQLALPRMIDMRQHGWTSGDCLVPRSSESLPMRMTAEDLHVARVIGITDEFGRGKEKPIPGRRASEFFAEDGQFQTPDGWPTSPIWTDAESRCVGGLVFYGQHTELNEVIGSEVGSTDELASLRALAKLPTDTSIRVAIENPFGWLLPIWLASERIDGMFVLGDWLQLDQPIHRIKDGRVVASLDRKDATQLGREVEQIHWQLMEAGFRLAPLAGSGDDPGNSPVGYNRLYVAGRSSASSFDSVEAAVPVTSDEQWWQAAWSGCSIATNGPLMRTNLNGFLPGREFTFSTSDPLADPEANVIAELTAEVMLTVRDPVEYLEVIHNGRLHYGAKLDEFAKAGGRIPPLKIKGSGWATVRVVTLYEDHFRAVLSSPWYFQVDGSPRITDRSVAFFQEWLGDTEQRLRQLPPEQLKAVAPFVRVARKFWADRSELAAAP
nr:hypothetical protein [Rhodopirellula sp. JC740]